MTAADQAIRKLAEEIAGKLEAAYLMGRRGDEFVTADELTPLREADLRVFLAEQQAALLGELAAKTEALSFSEMILLNVYSNAQKLPWQDIEALGRDGLKTARAALSGEAGKLAAEVIREAIEERKVELTHDGSDAYHRRHKPTAIRRRQAVDALLAATGKGERNG
jgi:hypothetical protein